jgi:hypothetical protein
MNAARLKYLARKGVVGPWAIDGGAADSYIAAVVIPACDEEEWLFDTLVSLAKNRPGLLKKTLILVVLNQPEQTSAEVAAANCRTLQKLKTSPLNAVLQLAWIDACSPGLALPVGGAGAARRLGLDRVLERLDSQLDPILICLDADTLVDANYLESVLQHFSGSLAGGAVVPFEHQAAETKHLQSAIDHYELFLRCYVFGLQLAGSPYAFHSVGSTMACRASAYVGAGGMSQRPAGEDFYFLQNLAKTVGVESVRGTCVYPAARISGRVPFGTGPALLRLQTDPDQQLFYPVESFQLLGKFLQLVTRDLLFADTLQLEADRLNPELGQFMSEQKLATVTDRLRRNHLKTDQYVRAFHCWFDGLKSLRLLRRICDGKPFSMSVAQKIVPDLMRQGGLNPANELSRMLDMMRISQNNR